MRADLDTLLIAVYCAACSLFCAEQDPKWFETAEPDDGPTVSAMQELARRHEMVLVVPFFEKELEGVFYNTAVVIDADGTVLGKYRKTHIPQVGPIFWEKYFFKPGNLGYPVFDTRVGRVGVFICYDRHFPEPARMLGLKGAQLTFNPSATVESLSRYLRSWSSRRTRSRTGSSSGRSTASARRSSPAHASTGRATSAIRAGRSSPRPRTQRTKYSSPTSTSA